MSDARKDAVAARFGAAAQKASRPAHAVIDHLDALKPEMVPLPIPTDNEKEAQ